jgi:hypothetical protein
MTASRQQGARGDRPPLADQRRERAERIVDLAWRDLPIEHRRLLESIGAAQWKIVDEPLASSVDGLLRSAGFPRMSQTDRLELAHAVGVWIEELRVVLIDAGHSVLAVLDDPTFEMIVVRTAWHEWGHALSVVRAESGDVADGQRLLGLAPEGVSERIRRAGYRRSEYTHELVAETYALLMSRRRRGEAGKPPWLAEDIYQLVRRVSGWNE